MEHRRYLCNCWCVAGWSKDHTCALRPQTLLGENIVVFRKADGTTAALEDACPSSKIPLSMGQLGGDTVVSGYHGLTFVCTGRCTDSPTQRGMTSRRAVVRSYPVVDRYRLLWIWMGDPEQADPNEIFEIENFDNPAWDYTNGGVLSIACNYLWVEPIFWTQAISHLSLIHI